MPFRLLVLDVDGTFIRSDKTVSPAVMAAVGDLVARGFPVTFATGRMFEAIREWVEGLGLRTPVICNNGADIIDPVTEERLTTIALTPASVTWLLDRGRADAVTTVLFSGSRVLGRAHTDDDWLIERNNETVQLRPEPRLYDPELRVEKLLFLDRHNPGNLERIRDEIRARTLPGTVGFECQVSEPGILNFSHPDANKVRALDTLCAKLGIEADQTIAVGDGDNDAAVLAHAGLGIAMGNATTAARAAARHRVPDNDHDGLAVAVREVILPLLDRESC